MLLTPIVQNHSSQPRSLKHIYHNGPNMSEVPMMLSKKVLPCIECLFKLSYLRLCTKFDTITQSATNVAVRVGPIQSEDQSEHGGYLSMQSRGRQG